ncbi:hypothetical protein GF318_03015 [Candidatus Micrarchaeota archaeon]|nr:hypothetical protein [Candidatus Micrarchaeota archaeon]
MKGQSSLELLVTVGIVVAFTLPVIFLMFSFTSVGYEDTAIAQAEAASRTLSDTMNSVYSQGPGAERRILMNVPASTERIYVDDREVVVQIETSRGTFEAVHTTMAETSGVQDLSGKTGLFIIDVRNENGKVRLVDPYSS